MPLNFEIDMYIWRCFGSHNCNSSDEIDVYLNKTIVNISIILFENQYDTRNKSIN